ncbi:MAG: sensor histidine kinase, partial [Salibacteraceae bacterium]
DTWIRLPFEATEATRNVTFFLDLKRLFQCEVYVGNSTEVQHHLGEQRFADGRYNWHHPSFQHTFPAHEPQTLTIRVKAQGNYLLFPVEAYSTRAWENYLIRNNLLSGLFYGALLLLLLSNLFVTFRYRKRSILFYFFYGLSVSLVLLLRDGHLLTIGLGEHPNWFKIIVSNLIQLAQVSNLAFVYVFFQLPKTNPWLSRIFQGVMVLEVGLIASAWLEISGNWLLRVNSMAVVLVTFLVVLSGYVVSVRPNHTQTAPWFGKWYLSSYLVFLFGVLLALGAVRGWLLHGFFDTGAIKLAFLAELLMLSISLVVELENRQRKVSMQLQVDVSQAKQERAKLQEDMVRAELKGLVALMKPHFIFNSLNSIQHYVMQGDKKQAHLYISRFSRLMRQNLEFSSRSLISIQEELEAIELYVELEIRRLDKAIRFECVPELQQDPASLGIPPFLLQPLLENAFWHGFNHPQITEGLLELRLQQYADRIEITVCDNGVGLHATAQQTPAHHSMSGNITQNRLQLFEKSFGYDSAYTITDRSRNNEQGTRVHFYIPILQNL